jgi:uncharacterized protein YndB with AHSA1/START domain
MSLQPAPIKLVVETPADAELAWETITDPDRIVEWFTEATSLGRPGDPYRLDFGDSAVEGTILSVDPGRAFAYTWSWEGTEEGSDTQVSWTVESLSSGGSRITLEHTGWPETTPDDTARADHLGYWEAYLEDLAALLSG